MACKDFFRENGLTVKDPLQDLTNAVFNEGVGCINANLKSCSSLCNNLTKTQEACFSCLEQVNSCPGEACRTVTVDCAQDPDNDCCPTGRNNGSCCPTVRSAVKCGTCVARRGGNSQSLEAFEACLKSGGLGKIHIIIIAVCATVGTLIIIAAIVIGVKLRKSAQQRSKLVANLQKEGVDHRLIHDIGDLDYSRINSSVFKDVNERIALKKATSRLKKVPPPVNTQARQLSSASEGLFSL